jgi:hypothetical protein
MNHRLGSAMVLMLFFSIIPSCASFPHFIWSPDPSTGTQTPLPDDTMVYIYYGSQIAGFKADKWAPHDDSAQVRDYVLCTIYRGAHYVNTIGTSYYKTVESTDYFNEEKRNKSKENLFKWTFKKYLPNISYQWMNAEEVTRAASGHTFLGRGKMRYASSKDEFHSALAMHALKNGANMIFLMKTFDQYQKDDKGKEIIVEREEKEVAWIDGMGREVSPFDNSAKYKRTKTRIVREPVFLYMEFDYFLMRYDELLRQKP